MALCFSVISVSNMCLVFVFSLVFVFVFTCWFVCNVNVERSEESSCHF